MTRMLQGRTEENENYFQVLQDDVLAGIACKINSTVAWQEQLARYPVLEQNSYAKVVETDKVGWAEYDSPAPNPCCAPGKLRVLLNYQFSGRELLLQHLARMFRIPVETLNVNIWCIVGTVGFHKDISRKASLNIPLLNGAAAITTIETVRGYYVGYRMLDGYQYLLNSAEYPHAILFDKQFSERWFLGVHFYEHDYHDLQERLRVTVQTLGLS